MSPTDLNAIRARLGSLSFEARSKLASHSSAVFKLVTIDLPALIAELEATRQEDVWHRPKEHCGKAPAP